MTDKRLSKQQALCRITRENINDKQFLAIARLCRFRERQELSKSLRGCCANLVECFRSDVIRIGIEDGTVLVPGRRHNLSRFQPVPANGCSPTPEELKATSMPRVWSIGRRGEIPELLEKRDEGLRSRPCLYDGSLDGLAFTENADNLLSVRRCELHHAQST